MTKPSLLLISATYVVDENQKKIEHLSEHFDLVCVTCTEVASLGFDVTLVESVAPRNYRLIGLATFRRVKTGTRFLFKGLRDVFAGQRFDLILVEAEPWAWVRWQAWWWKRVEQPGALFGEFSWENVGRPGWRGTILRWIYRAAVRTADFVIGGNQAAGELFVQAGMPRSQVLIAPQLGVDEKLLSPLADPGRAALRAGESLAPDSFLIGFCGRFVEEKGVLDLVAAVDAMRLRQPSIAVELAMLGAGPLREELNRLARERPWLRLFAPRPHTKVASFMQMLDLFVLPSKPRRTGNSVWEEQFGHVLIEAMACGVPCLGSDSGEIPQVVGVGATFPAGDRPALAEKVEHILRDGPARNELARRQRLRTLQEYTNEALGETWAAFLHNCLEAHRNIPKAPV